MVSDTSYDAYLVGIHATKNEEVLAEEIEELEADEEEISVAGNRETRKGMDMEQALNVVAETVQTASNSMSGTTSGTSIQATGTSMNGLEPLLLITQER